MKSNSYWDDRVNQILADNHQSSTQQILRINQAYDKALKDVQHDIDKIFIKYAKGHNLTLAQAKKILNSKMDDFIHPILKRIYPRLNDGKLKDWCLAELNANAYRARITRLEALKKSIQLHCLEAYEQELKISKVSYINTINKAYYRTCYEFQKGVNLAFDVAHINQRAVNMILGTEWSGSNYSTRVWNNTQNLASNLDSIITRGFLSGKALSTIAKELEEQTEYGKYAAERLVRTETTFFNNQAALQGYKEVGVEKYIFVATLDIRTSKVCREHDRKVYLISEQLPGENCPPLHPFCRSTIRSYINEEILNRAKRRARDPETGKTYLVDNMSYEEWHNKYVKGNVGAELAEKKYSNRYTDKKQYDDYKKVLGKDVPKSFDKFQELKYTDSNSWKELKKDFRVQSSKYKGYLYKDDGTIVVTDDWKGEHVSIPKNYKPYAVVETNTEFTNGGMQIDRTIYDKEGMMWKQIHSGHHNKPKQHPYGNNGEHMHVYNWKTESGKPERNVLEITDQEKIEHRDILKGGS